MEVPHVLLSGNHREIRKWRETKSIEKTYKTRPDLLDKLELTQDQKTIVESLDGDNK